ncbi:putative factor for cell wall maintenance or synthesis [Fictibacillus macauensis ZFHKF-1]|uniref:Putative factor for cell wall maintenance or synthesis n=1 Tax=Fictibacillus macauensis ZFHKF-1 TaxID=1196324 RepID=I8J1P4_9BACL|nr:VanW family protein [Fictibacillus macauensis]EIT85656.1 putative factor for cell wall maintenance or synthesis [Fictibacillus macauensis ZFHKF-1]
MFISTVLSLLLATSSVTQPKHPVQPVQTKDSITLVQNGQTIAIVERQKFSLPLPGTPIVSSEKYNAFLKQLRDQLYIAPKNARIDAYGRIVPGAYGSTLNAPLFKEYFYRAFFDRNASKVIVPTRLTYPKVDSELLSTIRSNQLGRYMTYFNHSNASRIHNISLAAKAIDNHVVFPGETFSFNSVVGKRTSKRGYEKAPVIIKGELSEGVGGGICQVSSTLFNAADAAGLTIVQRFSHSRRVPYVPKGRDATVSWYGPDFRFYNHYGQPILIRAKAYGSSMAVWITTSEAVKKVPRRKK